MDAKRKQGSLNNFFSGAPPVKKTQEKLHPPEKARMLRLTTAEKWKAEDLAKYMADQWLIFQTKKEEILSMTCKYCPIYKEKIMSCKHYTASWATTGCTRLLLNLPMQSPHSMKFLGTCI